MSVVNHPEEYPSRKVTSIPECEGCEKCVAAMRELRSKKILRNSVSPTQSSPMTVERLGAIQPSGESQEAEVLDAFEDIPTREGMIKLSNYSQPHLTSRWVESEEEEEELSVILEETLKPASLYNERENPTRENASQARITFLDQSQNESAPLFSNEMRSMPALREQTPSASRRLYNDLSPQNNKSTLFHMISTPPVFRNSDNTIGRPPPIIRSSSGSYDSLSALPTMINNSSPEKEEKIVRKVVQRNGVMVYYVGEQEVARDVFIRSI